MSNNLLAGKRGVISGALNEQSIAWKVAEKCVEQGAIITLTNAPVAMRMGEIKVLRGHFMRCNEYGRFEQSFFKKSRGFGRKT